MKRKQIIFGVTVIFLAWLPMFMGAWDNDKPADSQAWNDAAGSIRDNNDAMEVVMGIDLLNNHPFFQAAAPTTKPDGLTALDSNDNGRLWIDSDSNILFVYEDPNWELSGETFLNVQSFGAVGDLVFTGSAPPTVVSGTDDTAAIQAAIDSIPSTAGTNGKSTTLYFPTGIYLISDTLTIRAGQEIVFYGAPGAMGSEGVTIMMAEEANKNFIDAATTTTNAVSVAGLQFQGKGPGSGTGNAILIGRTDRAIFSGTITDCWFTQIPNAGIKCGNMQDFKISNCGFEGSNYGIFLDTYTTTSPTTGKDNSENNISGCRFDGLLKAAINVEGGNHNVIRGNLFDEVGNRSGVANDDTVGAIIITSSTAPAVRSNIISGNQFGGTSGGNLNDILILGTPSGVTQGVMNTHIVGNISDQAIRHFLFQNAAFRTSVIGNQINDCGNETAFHTGHDEPAIEIIGTSAKTTLFSNVITIQAADAAKQATYGLELGASTTDTVIGTNHFNGKTGSVNVISGAALVNPTVTAPPTHLILTLANNATPTVAGAGVWLTGGTTTITDFDDGVTGQVIIVIAEHALTITDGTNIFTPTGGNLAMNATDILMLVQKSDGKWYTVSFSDNT